MPLILTSKNFFLSKRAGKNVSRCGIKYVCKNLVQKDFKRKKTHDNQRAKTFWLAHIYVHKKYESEAVENFQQVHVPF